MDREELLERIVQLARRAGDEIMAVYATDFAVEGKSDDSPVTAADRRAEQVILAGLYGLTPVVPAIAEEQAAAGIIPEVGEATGWSIRWTARASSSSAAANSPSTSA